ASSDAVEIFTGGPSLTYNGSVTQNNSGRRAIHILAATSGSPTISFGGQVTSNGGAGINFQNNTGATVHFTGGITASTGTANAFTATGGGTVDVTGNTNTLTTTTGTALNVQNTNIGSADLNFQSITAGTGANANGNGIILDNTGNAGNLIVTGTGANGTGGTIQHFTGADGATNSCAALGSIPQGVGIFLRNTVSPSLDSMNLHDFSNFALLGYTVSGTTTLDQMVINGTNGDNASQDDGSVMFCGLTGSASLSSSTVTGGFENGFRVYNTSGTLNRLSVSGTTFATGTGALSDDAFLARAENSAILNVTINQDSTFTTASGDLLNFVLSNTAAGDLVVDDSHFSNNHPSITSGGGGVTIGAGGAGSNPTLTYSITNSDFKNALGNAVTLSTGIDGAAAGTYTGSFTNNTIGVSGQAGSGSAQGNGIAVNHAGSGTHKTNISNNTIRQYRNSGIKLLLTGLSNTPIIRATVKSNTVNQPFSTVIAGIFGDMGRAGTICLDLGGAGGEQNSVSGGDDNNLNDIAFLGIAGGTYNLPGYVGPNSHDVATSTAVQTFEIARNSGDGPPTAFADTVPNYTGAGSNCL
ncbi:MAG TPA: hypothetical protein VIG64_10885, partial [Actinomycetota bacterium]